MIRLSLVIIFLLSFLKGICQYSNITLVYRLSNEAYEEKIRSKNFKITPGDCKLLIGNDDTLSYLMPGYYIHASANNENLNLWLGDETNISTILLNNERDFAVQVVDSIGQLIYPAQAWLDHRKLKYDITTKSYRLPKQKEGGLLKVEALGQVVFYEVTSENSYNYHKRFQHTRFGRIITTPVRWGKSIVYYFKRGFKWNDWHINWINNIFKEKDKSFKGYIALNKPIYRHGDTLQLKAYVVDHKGNPWKDGVYLNISGNRFNKNERLEPDENGSLFYKMVIGDSLTLDQKYNITISDSSNDYEYRLYHTFQLEDYQLDEVDYTFSSSQPAYQKGEKIILLAEGKDKNGFTIADGEVKIIALRGNVKYLDVPEFYIPDTLWTHTQALDTRGATQIIFPDSLLPKAELEIKFQATFTNSNGELHEKATSINYVARLSSIKIELQNGYIVADYLEGEQSVPIAAKLSISGNENIRIDKIVNLPSKEKLHPFARYYTFSIPDKNVSNSFSFYNQEANVNVSGIYIKDSVFVNITNPHQIPVNYWISRGEHIIESGQTSETQFKWQRKDKNYKTYHVRYQYLWSDNPQSDVLTIQSYKDMLHLDVTQPDQIIPGAPAQVKVKVSDQKNNNIQGVNLTAGAVNAQFNAAGSFSSMEVNYRQAKPLKKYHNFDIERKEDYNTIHPLTKDWYEKLNLKDQIYYQLRFSEQAFYTHYDTIKTDSFYRNVALFSPYVIREGLSEPIIMIYCNRKLIYYYEADQKNTPYSFEGKEGYNLITIRTPKYEYWIDSVLLKKGQKLEFSINEATFTKDSLMYRKQMPDSLTASERKLLNSKILFLKNIPTYYTYVWQDSSAIHLLYNDNYSKILNPVAVGPFNATQPIYYQDNNRFRTRFTFEPGFSYDIAPRRERLYESKHFDQKLKLPKKLPTKHWGQLIYKNSAIPRLNQPIASPINMPLKYNVKNNVKNGGSFQFYYNPYGGKYVAAIALVKDSSNVIERFQSNVRFLRPLEAGSYSLTLVNNLYEFYQQRIIIKRDSLLYFNFGNIPWQQDTSELVKKLFFQEPVITKNEMSVNESYDIPMFYKNNLQGRITDENGEPLIGATILVKGTTIGTVSDVDGYYVINLPDGLKNPTLIFSYTGYDTKEMPIDDNNSIVDITMGAQYAALSEVVVTGYGISNNRISTSTADISALQGRVAGLNISSNEIKIRGSRSLSENYYIDGKNVSENSKLNLSNFNLIESSVIRSNFRDYAYWQPNLITDQKGEAYFTVTYPDNITSWNTFVLGMDRKLRAGVAYGNTKSYKPLLAQLAMPRFLVEGDEVDIIGKSVNYTNDTLYVNTSFKIGEQLLQENNTDVIDGITEKAKVIAPAQQDSIHATYALAMGEYIDGEQRSIPIFRRGMEDTKGYFYVLNKDTTIQIMPQLPEGQLEVYIEGNMLNDIIREILKLKNYQYGCNEQTASRLLAALMDKKITEQLGKKYSEDDNIKKLVDRLEKTQNKEGSWGWWSGNAWDHWMNIYVTSALHEAKKAGFSTPALNKALPFIIQNTEKLNRYNLIYMLQMLAESEVPFDFETLLAQLDTTQLDLYERFMTIRIKQKLGREYSLDSIYHYQQKNTFGSVFWEQEKYYWYNKTLYPTLLAYEILREAGKTEQLPLIRQYFFQHKNVLYWGNTFKTAHVLHTILPDILKENSLDAIQNEACIINNQKITRFPYKANYTANQNLTISKSGKTPVFFTAYQHFFNTQPERKEDLFSIKSTLYQYNKPTSYLQQGEKATLKVEVEVKEKAEYVLIEIPIPAGCSYAEKPNGWRFPEVHREYFKEKTAIFCQELSAGKYKFYIELEPRFTGNFTLNPVKMEQMYFPNFNGNNEMKRVLIKE